MNYKSLSEVLRYAKPTTKAEQLAALMGMHNGKNKGYTGDVSDWLHPDYKVIHNVPVNDPYSSRSWTIEHSPSGTQFIISKKSIVNRFKSLYLPNGRFGDYTPTETEYETPEDAMRATHQMLHVITGGKHGEFPTLQENDSRPDSSIPEDYYA